MKKLMIVLLLLPLVTHAQKWEWAKNGGPAGNAAGGGMSTSTATDIFGNSFIVGYFFSPTITFGAVTLHNSRASGTNQNMFIVKYDASGNVLWANSSNASYPYFVTADAAGSVYVTGNFSDDTVTFGSTTFINGGLYDMFLVKYDSSGNFVWAKQGMGNGTDGGTSVVTDPAGNLYVAGDFNGSWLVFGGDSLTYVAQKICLLQNVIHWVMSSGQNVQVVPMVM